MVLNYTTSFEIGDIDYTIIHQQFCCVVSNIKFVAITGVKRGWVNYDQQFDIGIHKRNFCMLGRVVF